MKRPALVALLFLIAGLVVGRFITLPPLLIFATIFLLLSVYLILLTQKPTKDALPYGLLLFMPLLLIGLFQQNRIIRDDGLGERIVELASQKPIVELTGKVAQEPTGRDLRISVVLKDCRVKIGSPQESSSVDRREQEIRLPTRILAICSHTAANKITAQQLIRGDIITIRGKLAPPPYLANPYIFNYRAFLKNRGISGIIRCYTGSAVEIEPKKGLNPVRWFLKIVAQCRQQTIRVLEENLGEEPALIAQSFLLGRSHRLKGELREHFLRTGLMHLFAVSGLHTGLVAIFLFSIFRLFRLELDLTYILVIIGLLFFCAFTGFRAPVLRATIMVICLLGSTMARRLIEPISSLTVAALLVLIVNPRALWQVDFQFSYLSVAAIILLMPVLGEIFHIPTAGLSGVKRKRLLGINKTVIDPTLVIVAVQLGLFPLLAHYYHRFPIIAIPSNLIIVFLLVFPIISLSIVLVILGSVIPPLVVLIAPGLKLLIAILLFVVKLFSGLPFASLNVPSLPWFVIGGYYLILFSGPYIIELREPGALLKRRARFIITIALICALIIWIPIIYRHWSELDVYFLNVGQGDSIYMEFPDGSNMLIDGGGNFPVSQGQYVVGPFLQALGVDEVRAVVATHPDGDHIGGLPWVLRHFYVDVIIEGGAQSSSAVYRDFQQAIEESGTLPFKVKRGDKLYGFDDAQIKVLHPTEKFREEASSNNQSVVLRIVFKDVALLFTGDAEIEAEQDIIKSGLELRSEVLKAGHHGSRTSSSAPFLQAVKPNIVIFSVGANNPYGHPHKQVVERCEELGIKCFRTDRDGAIFVRTNGRKILVSPFAGN